MTHTFETDGMTLLLPEAAPVLIEADKARDALKRERRVIERSHIYPLIDAVAHFGGCPGFC